MTDNQQTTEDKPKAGRPRELYLTDEQLIQMDDMSRIQCKHRTIAEVLGVSRDELTRHYLPRLHKKSAEGRVELRRNQAKMATNQAAMAIFLGKQKGILDQSDRQEVKHSGEVILSPPVINLVKSNKD